EVDEPLEAEREPARGNVGAEEAADHAVVASAAAERAARGGVRDLEDGARVVAHAAHEGGVEDEVDVRNGGAQGEQVAVGIRVEPDGGDAISGGAVEQVPAAGAERV